MSLYVPLDEILGMPRVRVLRALRHFEWVTLEELFLSMGLLSNSSHEWRNLVASLCRAYKAGQVKRRGKANGHCHYRITAVGRAELKRRLQVDMTECAA